MLRGEGAFPQPKQPGFWLLKGIWVYIFYVSKKKNYVFLMWNLRTISIYILCFQEKNCFFNVE
jgi:hypothetical protein